MPKRTFALWKNIRDPLAEQEQAKVDKVADAERSKAEGVTLRDVADHYIANKKTRNGPLKANTVRDINVHVDKSFAAWKDRPIKATSPRSWPNARKTGARQTSRCPSCLTP